MQGREAVNFICPQCKTCLFMQHQLVVESFQSTGADHSRVTDEDKNIF